LPIRRKSLPNDPDFVDASAISRLYTSDNCKTPLRCSPDVHDSGDGLPQALRGAVCVAPASSPHAVKPRSRKGTEPGPHLTARDSSNTRAMSAGARSCLHRRGSSDQSARDWVVSDLSQVPHAGRSACSWRCPSASEGTSAARRGERANGSALDQRPMVMSCQRMRALEESLERVEPPEIGRTEDPYPAWAGGLPLSRMSDDSRPEVRERWSSEGRWPTSVGTARA
jgi:hypothetical protein